MKLTNKCKTLSQISILRSKIFKILKLYDISSSRFRPMFKSNSDEKFIINSVAKLNDYRIRGICEIVNRYKPIWFDVYLYKNALAKLALKRKRRTH